MLSLAFAIPWAANAQTTPILPQHGETGNQDASETTVTQTIALNEGWNWVSFYVESDNLLEQLKAGLGTSGQQIRTQGGALTYIAGMWMGTLVIDQRKGYQIKTNAPVEVTITGSKFVNPAEFGIEISQNWNWIGYPVSASQAIANAFSSDFQPGNSDQIKTQGGAATYLMGNWMPGTFTLVPGKSYLYKSSSSVQKTLVFSNGGR